MTNDTLGRLVSIDPRSVWATEAGDFTPWLAQENNLALLGDAIGLDLEFQAIEQNVGPFRADIVCKDTATSNLVLIENQLEKTDHVHLGQLLTYAAGLNAVTVVWIAHHFVDEHRAALDWLNSITPPSINFFGLEVELWRIGNSNIAPKFNIASKPNDWIKVPGPVAITSTRAWQLEYWTVFMAYVAENSQLIKQRQPLPQHWASFAVGKTDFALSTIVHARKRYIGVELDITGSNAKVHFHLLFQDKDAVEAEIGHKLEWNELPDKKSSYVNSFLHDTDPENRDDWPRQHRWMLDTLEAYHRCFSPRIRRLAAPVKPPVPIEVQA